MTLRVPISYAVGLVLVTSLTACSSSDAAGSGAGTTTSVTSSSPTSPAPTTKTPGSPSPSTSGPVAAAPDGRTIEITVTGREVDPAPSTVSLGVGDRLTLLVTSDHDDTLHIHGFDVEEPLTAGAATSVTLTGAQPGVYEVETHHPELRLLKIAGR